MHRDAAADGHVGEDGPGRRARGFAVIAAPMAPAPPVTTAGRPSTRIPFIMARSHPT